MKNDNIKTINAHQQQIYDLFERETAAELLKGYRDTLNNLIGGGGKSLKILDLGGGAGHFAMSLRSCFPDKRCEIFVLDTTQYGTWTKNADKITFVKDSAENLSKLFAEETFDLIFANRVFHHFVKSSWSKSFRGMADIMKQVAFILKKNGLFCVTDHFFNGRLHHTSTSKIIYALTSIKLKPIAMLFRKLEAHTAGIGVCFLSKKMWLHLFSQTGFIIEALKESPNRKLKWYEDLFLFIKNHSGDNVIILQKKAG
ncbi:MAG: class I SAM-dependent methyltransferase [Prevotellaceae bacterium]|jgi:ubiquinone/menaquinone biosynthesis C-methylase UbiE|nr:class I SAM-dependent methyltransferase [Prevotellaceae bacterium]